MNFEAMFEKRYVFAQNRRKGPCKTFYMFGVEDGTAHVAKQLNAAEDVMEQAFRLLIKGNAKDALSELSHYLARRAADNAND